MCIRYRSNITSVSNWFEFRFDLEFFFKAEAGIRVSVASRGLGDVNKRQTQVTVNDGDTVVIGGLITENAIENKKFIPILSDIPFLGKMFQSTSIEKEQRELFIFITPNIIQ